jgi:tetratricopeptide (TPR) repeat protein
VTLDQLDQTYFQKNEEIKHTILERVGTCFDKLGKRKEASNAYERAFEYDNRCSTCFSYLFSYHFKEHDYDKAILLIRSVDEPIAESGCTRLAEWLAIDACRVGDLAQSIHEVFRRKKKDVPFIVDIYQSAIATAPNYLKEADGMWLELQIAKLLSDCNYHPEQAEEIWENIIRRYHSTKEHVGVRYSAEIAYSLHCLKRSAELGKDAAETSNYGAILERLAKKSARPSTDPWMSTTLGGWYKIKGQNEKAQVLFLPLLKQGLYSLSDNDSEKRL